MIQKNGTFEPERMCTACRKRDAKENLLRIVQEDGAFRIDREQKAQLRGVYMCKNMECVCKAQKTRALARAFKCAVDESVYEMLARSIEKD